MGFGLIVSVPVTDVSVTKYSPALFGSVKLMSAVVALVALALKLVTSKQLGSVVKETADDQGLFIPQWARTYTS